MQSPEIDNVVGAALIPGFVGAALSLSYAKELTRKQAIVAVALGCAVAKFGAPLVMHWLGSAWAGMDGCVGFFLGLFTMPLVPALQTAVGNLKNLRTPLNPPGEDK